MEERNKTAWELAKALHGVNSGSWTPPLKAALQDSLSTYARSANGFAPKAEPKFEPLILKTARNSSITWDIPAPKTLLDIRPAPWRKDDLTYHTRPDRPPTDYVWRGRAPIEPPAYETLLYRPEHGGNKPVKTPYYPPRDVELPGGALPEPPITRVPLKIEPQAPLQFETLDIETDWRGGESNSADKPVLDALAVMWNKMYNKQDTASPDAETLALYKDWHKDTVKPITAWPEDDSPDTIQVAQYSNNQADILRGFRELDAASVSAGADVSNSRTGVRASNELQGNTVEWHVGTSTGNSTITITSGGKYTTTLKEGTDYHIDSNGIAQYYSQPGNAVRDAYGGNVEWVPGAAGGANGSSIITPDGTLREGADYYIGNDGRAYFNNDDWYKDTAKTLETTRPVDDLPESIQTPQHSNSKVGIRTSNESQGNKVEWKTGTTPGNSTITITSGSGYTTTLREGSDYYISPDGTAYYINRPETSVRGTYGDSITWVPGDGGVTAGAKIITADGTLIEGLDFYVGDDGKAYFYSNVTTILQANGNYIASEGAGKITYIPADIVRNEMVPGSPFYTADYEKVTLVEGVDYYVGSDNKAHFFNGPPPLGWQNKMAEIIPDTDAPSSSTETPVPGSNVNDNSDIAQNWNYPTNDDKFKYLFGEDYQQKQFYQTAAEAESHMVTVKVPAWRYDQHGNKEKYTKNLTVNKKIADMVVDIFQEIYELPEQFVILNDFTGAYNWRYDRTEDDNYFSEHTHGVAIDINWTYNPFYSSAKPNSYENGPYDEYTIHADSPIVEIFKKYGWTWGGDWNSVKDYMHFQWFLE